MNKRQKVLVLGTFALLLVAIFFGPSIRNEVTAQLLLRQDSPDADAVYSMIEASSVPEDRIVQLWKTQRIPHRYLAMSYLKGYGAPLPTLSEKVDRIIDASIVNVDNNVRELALGFLSTRNPESLTEALRRQIYDTDLEMRLTALRILPLTENKRLTAEIVRLLDDPEPTVAAAAAGVLRSWTGENFGIRNQDAIIRPQADGSRVIPPENLQRLQQGLEGWKNWWTSAKDTYPPVQAMQQPLQPPKLPTADFQLDDLEGNQVTLSEFRGKTVLLNFWTTWCTACAIEVPDLVELNNRHPEDLVILAISLDGAYGHGNNLATFTDPKKSDENAADLSEVLENSANHGQVPNGQETAKTKKKIKRVVRNMGINYRILLDPSGKIGNRFNGQELPTNVLIDKDGFVRRRFLGSRPLSTWEALIAEIQ